MKREQIIEILERFITESENGITKETTGLMVAVVVKNSFNVFYT